VQGINLIHKTDKSVIFAGHFFDKFGILSESLVKKHFFFSVPVKRKISSSGVILRIS